jgi:hypothetical protein
LNGPCGSDRPSPAPMLTDDMKRLVLEQKLGFAADGLRRWDA